MKFKIFKVLLSLPSILDFNSIYLKRIGAGFEFWSTTKQNGVVIPHPTADYHLGFYQEITTADIITTNTNNYNPTNLQSSRILKISSSSNISISGLTAPAYSKIIFLINVGDNQITLQNNHANSTAGNRFLFNGNVALKQNESVILFYDKDGSQKWYKLN